MRRAFCRVRRGRLLAAVLALVLVTPVVSRAAPITFHIFNLGKTTAYVVQRNTRTVATQATSSEGVFAERVDASIGDQIVLAPDLDLAPPVPFRVHVRILAEPGCVHLSWTPSGDPSVIGYRIGYGVLSITNDRIAEYQYATEVGPVSSYDLCSLPGATYYFAVQAINYAGQMSAYSEERTIELATTAVLISHFDARAARDAVRLSWSIESDENITGYLIYRRRADASEQALLATPLAAGTTGYLDSDVRRGTHYTYVLAVLRDDGSELRSAPASATTPSLALALEPNAPNPFRRDTRIPFTLETTSHVSVTIYDVHGARVATLMGGALSEGAHDVGWDGHNDQGQLVASGTYFCVLRANKQMLTRKMLLVR